MSDRKEISRVTAEDGTVIVTEEVTSRFVYAADCGPNKRFCGFDICGSAGRCMFPPKGEAPTNEDR